MSGDRAALNKYLRSIGVPMAGDMVHLACAGGRFEEIVKAKCAVVVVASLPSASVRPWAWLSLDRFRKDPVCLLEHDYEGLPIAWSMWERVRETVDGYELRAKLQFHRDTDLSRTVWGRILDGQRYMVALGILPERWTRDSDTWTVTKTDILEISLVPVNVTDKTETTGNAEAPVAPVPLRFDHVKDLGERREASTGAVRDRATGKGRYDLLSPIAMQRTAQALHECNLRATALHAGEILDRAIGSIFAYVAEGSRCVFDHLAISEAHIHEFIHRQELAAGAPMPTPSFSNVASKLYYLHFSPLALARLARHFENGARKYTDRNWERGIPLSWFIDSALRHLFKVVAGLTDEDHAAAAEWNIHCAIHTEAMIHAGKLPAELADLPEPGTYAV
jgi:hypothetical protein